VSESAKSTAERSFAAAEQVLHDLAFPDPRQQPPLRLVVREAPMRVESNGTEMIVGTSPPSPALVTHGVTLANALLALENGSTTTRALVEFALDAAASHSDLGAVVACDEKDVLEQADVLDVERRMGKLRGPLHGLPLTVKDIIDVAGLPTRGGSLAYDDVPSKDATAVARLRRDGALLFAKVATHEFALGVATPQCRNPYDPTKLSGGSSGGSAIAAALGIGVGSLGTDTRASLRVPAALCGVVGFKPTFGRIPADGIIPLSWTIDHLGPITQTVEDASILFNSLADEPFLDRGALRTPGVLGVVPEVLADADPLIVKACEHALTILTDAGWRVREVRGPSIADLELSNSLGLLISRSEAAAFHRSQETDLSKCIPEVREQLLRGLTITGSDYLDAQRQRAILGQRILEEFVHCDVLVSPTTPLVAPRREDYERYLLRLSRNTIIWSLIGAPAVSIPIGLCEEGLPAGIQFAAAPGNEQTLVNAGMTLERGLGFYF
jgi:aspartyl-tRNA(Asn)/glutamyl-tRNA(Gln) amidotransferase subunit A